MYSNRYTFPVTALLWFDFALTLPDEYRRIWKRKFSGATVIYLLMRYVAVIERIFLVLEILVWNSSNRVSCSRFGFEINVAETFLDVRYPIL